MTSMLKLQPFFLFLAVEQITLNSDMWEDGMPNPWGWEREEEEEMTWRWREDGDLTLQFN